MESTAAITERLVESTAASNGIHCMIRMFKVFGCGMQCTQRIPLKVNLPKGRIDCEVIAFVSGLRCTPSKRAVHRIPLQKLKIRTFGTVMTELNFKKMLSKAFFEDH